MSALDRAFAEFHAENPNVYARLIQATEPDLADVFETRELAAVAS